MIELNCSLGSLDISGSDSEEITKAGRTKIKTVRNRATRVESPTALHVAVSQKNEELIKHLLESNANPSNTSRLLTITFAQTFSYKDKKWLPSGYEGRHVVSSEHSNCTAYELAERLGCGENIKSKLRPQQP